MTTFEPGDCAIMATPILVPDSGFPLVRAGEYVEVLACPTADDPTYRIYSDGTYIVPAADISDDVDDVLTRTFGARETWGWSPNGQVHVAPDGMGGFDVLYISGCDEYVVIDGVDLADAIEEAQDVAGAESRGDASHRYSHMWRGRS